MGAFKRIVDAFARTGRHQPPVADARCGIDDEDRKILLKIRVLKSVIHDDKLRTAAHRRRSAFGTPHRNPGRRSGGEQQRLVADIGGTVMRGIDPYRAPLAPAMATGQKVNGLAGRHQTFGDGQRHRRLPGTARRQVADADDRHGGALGHRAAAADASRHAE